MEILTLQDFVQRHQPRALLLDAYGVFWGGGSRGALPGALEAMRHLKSLGCPIGVLSNASSTSVREESKVAQVGMLRGLHFDFYLTSGEVARGWMRQQAALSGAHSYFALGEPHPLYGAPHEGICREAGLQSVSDPQQAGLLVCHIPHLQGRDVGDVELFRPMLEPLLAYHKPMVCLNPDPFALEGNQVPVVRQGALARLYESMGGEVRYLGKPYPEVFEVAVARFQELGDLQPHQIWMVGDTPETDIRGARAAGLRSALTWQTGIFGSLPEAQRRVAYQALPDTDRPDTLIERFAWALDL